MREGGLITRWTEYGVDEAPTQTCAHCCKIMVFARGADPEKIGGFCYGCSKAICPRCIEKRVCEPIEKWLEKQEASYHARRSYEQG